MARDLLQDDPSLIGFDLWQGERRIEGAARLVR
jgi:hypothetical protein